MVLYRSLTLFYIDPVNFLTSIKVLQNNMILANSIDVYTKYDCVLKTKYGTLTFFFFITLKS